MKTTRYFEEQVVRKRPYIVRAWCAAALVGPLRREIQADGRIRNWIEVEDARDGKLRILPSSRSKTVKPSITPSSTGTS
jgi:hypothetical protein